MFETGERLNVGQIVAASTLSRTAVSHHLRVLREAGVLRSEKVGQGGLFLARRATPCETRLTRSRTISPALAGSPGTGAG